MVGIQRVARGAQAIECRKLVPKDLIAGFLKKPLAALKVLSRTHERRHH